MEGLQERRTVVSNPTLNSQAFTKGCEKLEHFITTNCCLPCFVRVGEHRAPCGQAREHSNYSSASRFVPRLWQLLRCPQSVRRALNWNSLRPQSWPECLAGGQTQWTGNKDRRAGSTSQSRLSSFSLCVLDLLLWLFPCGSCTRTWNKSGPCPAPLESVAWMQPCTCSGDSSH